MLDFLFGPEPIRWVQQLFGLDHPLPFHLLSLLGDTWGMMLVVGLAFWAFGRDALYAVVGVVVVSAPFKVLLTGLFSQPRPAGPGIVVYEHLPVGSFPSGHVLEAVAPWALLHVLGHVPLVVPVLIALLVSVGRLYLGAHYLGDVLGGILFALVLVWAYVKLWPLAGAWLRETRFAFHATAAMFLSAGALAVTPWLPQTPRRYEVVGMVVGATLGLLLEARLIRYAPLGRRWSHAIPQVAAGIFGILPFLAISRAAAHGALWTAAGAAGLATFWTICGAPALFRWSGLSRRAHADRSTEQPIEAQKPELASEPVRVSTRPRYGRLAIVLLSGTIAVALVYGTAIEPRLLDIEAHVVRIPDLPPAWDGREVAVIADFQVGMWLANRGTVERAVESIVERRPAMLLLAGDFLYKPEESLDEQLEMVEEVLLPLAHSRIPTFAVLGNHDWGLNWPDETENPHFARSVRERLTASGVRVLRNQAVPLRSESAAEPLYIVGIGDAWAEEDRPREALAPVPARAARIVFMHNPASFAKLPPGTAPLAVAAHTHAGQVALPLLPEWSWLELVKGEPVHADGWLESFGAPGNRLYVNRGLGFSTFPIRINAVPEITWFTLRRAHGPPP